MRTCMKMFCLVAWLVAAGTMVETRAVAQAPAAGYGECYYVDGEWYCPCEEEEACVPPDCLLMGEEWYCQQDR